MTKVRKRYLKKRYGIKEKSMIRKVRKECKNTPKCNWKYIFQNYGFHFGNNESFIIQSTEIHLDIK